MRTFIASIFCFTLLFAEKDHEKWWQECLETQVPIEVFAGWLGPADAPSRVAMRKHVKKMGYRSMLDVPCGLAVDYWGLKKEGAAIQYTGLDITPKLVEKGVQEGVPLVLGSIEKIPFADSHFDLCYARHILEHLDHYQLALKELIRTASKEVLVVFFIKPRDKKDDKIVRTTDHGSTLFHNKYNRPKLEKFLRANPKVKKLQWEKVGDQEEILHIYLRS